MIRLAWLAVQAVVVAHRVMAVVAAQADKVLPVVAVQFMQLAGVAVVGR
jgi:hypothetical protein